jgi:hypothetical protein
VECGAGTAIPTVRHVCDHICWKAHHATLIRIDVGEPAVPAGQIGLAMSALEALRRIDEWL